MAGPYRDDTQALSDRLAHVRDELDDVRRRTQELEELKRAEAGLEREADALVKKLDARRALPLLESIRIASPCNASWDEMKGDDRVRFCGHCEKNVYNLSGMAREEAERLVAQNDSICVRLYKRADGTVLTQDCPVGVRKRRRRRVLAAVGVGGGLFASAAGAMFTTMGSPAPIEAKMGEIEIVRPPESFEMGQATMGEAVVRAPDAPTTAPAAPPAAVKRPRVAPTKTGAPPTR
jgi:hypothetical protein